MVGLAQGVGLGESKALRNVLVSMSPDEVGATDDNQPQKEEPGTDTLQSAYQAALAEEGRLWRAIHDPELQAADRVVAYARWRAAAQRVKELAVIPAPGRS